MTRRRGRLRVCTSALMPITVRGRVSVATRTRSRRIWSPNLGVFAVSAAGVLCAFCCVVDALPGECLRRTPGTSPLVAAVFRTKCPPLERCSATCQRRRRPGQARYRQGRLQITAWSPLLAWPRPASVTQMRLFCASDLPHMPMSPFVGRLISLFPFLICPVTSHSCSPSCSGRWCFSEWVSTPR